MKIDTLLLSACGTKGISYIGVFDCLIKHKVIQHDLNGIKKIIACSAGCIFAICILLKYKLDQMKRIILNYELSGVLDMNDLDDLFTNQGLFSNQKISEIIITLLKHKYGITDISLKEFYDKTKIELIVKVYNITDLKDEYISYKNSPNISIIQLIQMTTSIPIIFKPVLYNGKYYIDGGITGILPYTNIDDNYLGIYIRSKIDTNNILELTAVSYILRIINYINEAYDIPLTDKRIVCIQLDINSTIEQFSIDMDQKVKLLTDSYNQTYKHIMNYKLA